MNRVFLITFFLLLLLEILNVKFAQKSCIIIIRIHRLSIRISFFFICNRDDKFAQESFYYYYSSSLDSNFFFFFFYLQSRRQVCPRKLYYYYSNSSSLDSNFFFFFFYLQSRRRYILDTNIFVEFLRTNLVPCNRKCKVSKNCGGQKSFYFFSRLNK